MPLMEMHENGLYGGIGPHPSFVQVAKPFVFEQTIQQCLRKGGGDEARETSSRMHGVQWIDGVRRALNLPVRTFMTAVVYYHRFRLAHADAEYLNLDAAAAALFTACKIEDTLKKSRDILCAAHNLKASDHLTPDDAIFEDHAKRLLVLERLMLESSGFDFRNRNPQQWVIKFTRLGQFDRDTVGKVAHRICLDVYRTYGPLKQTSSTIGLACVELAARLLEAPLERLNGLIGNPDTMAHKWGTSRAEVMETLLDLLELYTHSRTSTSIGPEHTIDSFIALRITLNKESQPRFTEHTEAAAAPVSAADTNGKPTATTATPASPADNTTTPADPASPAQKQLGFRDGTVRYMLDAGRARDEADAVRAHFVEEWEEYEEVISRPAKAAPAPAPRAEPDRPREEQARRRSRERSPPRRRERGGMAGRYRDDRDWRNGSRGDHRHDARDRYRRR